MFHLALFDSSLAASTEAQISAVTDQILTIQDNGFLPQRNKNLAFAYGFGTDLQRAYLQSPTFRTITPPYIRPTQQGGTLPTNTNIADYRANPLLVKALEVLSAYGFQDNAGAQDAYIGIGLQSERRIAPQGNIFTMRGSSSTAAVADTWSPITMTWQDTLPAGKYAVVGMEIEGAAGIGARLILPDQLDRPGGPILSAESIVGPPMFRKGGLGLWGHFTSHDMPQVEVYATAATAAWVIYLDIIRVSNSPAAV